MRYYMQKHLAQCLAYKCSTDIRFSHHPHPQYHQHFLTGPGSWASRLWPCCLHPVSGSLPFCWKNWNSLCQRPGMRSKASLFSKRLWNLKTKQLKGGRCIMTRLTLSFSHLHNHLGKPWPESLGPLEVCSLPDGKRRNSSVSHCLGIQWDEGQASAFLSLSPPLSLLLSHSVFFFFFPI